MSRLNKLALYVIVFLAAVLIPFDAASVQEAILEAFALTQYYAREHVIFCLIPAFFIAGAIADFISQDAVLKYFGSKAKKWVSYSVASVSGTILAVCSCTILPLFAGIYKRGAGIGPAIAFLYSGPAINVLAILLTARVLGWQMGLARIVGAVVFAIVIGLLMAVIFKEEEQERMDDFVQTASEESNNRSGLQNIIYFATMVLILIFVTWTEPEQAVGLWQAIYSVKWYLAGGLFLVLLGQLYFWFDREEISSWLDSTWEFAELIAPLLLAGVLIAGFLMGRPGTEAGLIPPEWISSLVGGNSLLANFVASILGAFMYFATLTEIPILQGLLGLGMGEGPALALLLAGPALSLPNMLVIRSVIGTKKTAVFVVLVVIMSTISGVIYGNLVL
ncbi:permease [Fuchsiella alkaliacetigena]|uniref:permease n=1 Tax=Fuchsiella alkaliacetigena TaxID=957042 RepID=UPI00200AC945|nr:permease [Fuchsiella alkaliacetigena]MCK8825997.1 permease [Fuchsiella alkaliacetigena]